MMSYRETEARRAGRRLWIGVVVTAVVLAAVALSAWRMVERTDQEARVRASSAARARANARPSAGKPMPAFNVVGEEDYGRPFRNGLSFFVVTPEIDEASRIAEKVAKVGARRGHDEVTVFLFRPGMRPGEEPAAHVYVWRKDGQDTHTKTGL